MKHLIIGNGSLAKAIKEFGDNTADVFDSAHSFKYPSSSINLEGYSFIWNTAGAGTVGSDFSHCLRVHVQLVQYLAENAPKNSTIINFSTNYVADEQLSHLSNIRAEKPRSLYALSKKTMEEYLLLNGSANHKAIRVANLYGTDYPERGLPHRLITNNPFKLPINEVIPTPTDWLARQLLSNLDQIRNSDTVTSMAPLQSMPLYQFANLIGLKSTAGGIDPNRPVYSNIGNDYGVKDTVEKCWYESKYRKLFL